MPRAVFLEGPDKHETAPKRFEQRSYAKEVPLTDFRFTGTGPKSPVSKERG